MVEIDRRYCFQCDRWLGHPPSDERRLPLCGGCRADLDACAEAMGSSGEDDPPPEYLDTVALGLPLEGWPTEIALLTVDVWDRYLELHLVERPGTAIADVNPRLAATSDLLGDMTPRKWVLRTDVGTVHHSGGGGGGTPGTDRLLDRSWSGRPGSTLPSPVRPPAPGLSSHGRCRAAPGGERRMIRVAATSAPRPGGSSSLGLHTNELTFVPSLDPAATALTIIAPSAIDATAASATIQLPT